MSLRRKPRLVVVGNGMAGMRTVEELLKLDAGLYDITVFGAEPHGNYNRILLSPVLAGEKTVDDIMINTREWYAANGITLHAGDPVVEHHDVLVRNRLAFARRHRRGRNVDRPGGGRGGSHVAARHDGECGNDERAALQQMHANALLG